jgi:xylose isomerase
MKACELQLKRQYCAVRAAGWNGFTSLLNDAQNHLYNGASDSVSARMQAARAAGLSAIRIWGHGDGVQTLLQTDAGVYDEQVFRSLDYVVHQARLHNIRVRPHLTAAGRA